MSPHDEEISLPLDTAVLWCDKIFQRCCTLAEQPGGYDFPSLALFRRIIQMGDAIHILLSAGTSVPTLPLLRSMLESLISLKYIHLDDYKQRSLCWLCSYIHQQIAIKEMVDDATKEGRVFYEICEREFNGLRPNPVPGIDGVRRDAARFRELLHHPELVGIDAAYQKLVEVDRWHRPPKWYRILDGPKSLYKLAEKVEMASLYKFYYQSWSSSVHGTDIDGILERGGGFRDLRSAEATANEDAEAKQDHARIFLLMASKLMRRKFFSESDVDEVNAEMKSILTERPE